MKRNGVKFALAIGIVSLLLVMACAAPTPTATPTAAPTATPTAAPTATPTVKPTATPTVAPTATTTIKPIKLSFASVYPSDVDRGPRDHYFMDYITQKSGGAVTWTTYWGAALAAPAGTADLVIKGIVDFVDTSPLYTPGFMPDAAFSFSFPFNPEDPRIGNPAFRQMKAEFPQIEESYNRIRIKTLVNNIWAYYGMMSKTELKTLADLKGKKIGVIGKYFGRWMEPTGLVPVVSAATDRYTMVQTGVIDIDLLNISQQFAIKIPEVAKYRLEAGIGTFNIEGIMMSLDKYNSLQPELQKLIVEASTAAEDWDITFELNTYAELRKIEESQYGVKFNTLSDADKAAWAALLPDTPAENAAEMEAAGLPGFAMVKRYLELTTQLGYEWPRQWGIKK